MRSSGSWVCDSRYVSRIALILSRFRRGYTWLSLLSYSNSRPKPLSSSMINVWRITRAVMVFLRDSLSQKWAKDMSSIHASLWSWNRDCFLHCWFEIVLKIMLTSNDRFHHLDLTPSHKHDYGPWSCNQEHHRLQSYQIADTFAEQWFQSESPTI